MEDHSQENNYPNEPSGQRSGDDQEPKDQVHDHHRHHHRHAHRHTTTTNQSGRTKHRIEDLPGRIRDRHSESFFAKNFLRIAGIIFILAAIWFSISSVGPLKDTFKFVFSKEFFQVNERHHLTLSPGSETAASQQLSSPVIAGQTVKSHIWIMTGVILLLILLVISSIIRNQEVRVFTLIYWILFGTVWMIRYLFSGEKLLLWGFLGFSSLVYALYFFFNILKPRKEGKYSWSDYLIVLLNGLFYYLSVLLLIYKSGHSSYEWKFTIVLLVLNLTAILIADRFQKDYLRVPCLIFILFLVCLLFPLIAGSSTIILFLAPLALISMLYSKYTKARYTILVSVGSLLLMILVYLAYWIFVYTNAAFLGNILEHNKTFIKGTWTSAVVLVTIYTLFELLKHTEINLSKKVFDRSNWLKLLKGVLLMVIYLSLFWIYYYLFYSVIKNDEMRLMIWFSFNCLYLIAAIPYLGSQRSIFLRGTVIAGIVLNLAYPVFIQNTVAGFRNDFLGGIPDSFRLFRYHYFCVVLLILVLFLQLRFIRRAFPRMKIIIRGFYIYFSLFLIYLVLSEFEHVNLILALSKGAMLPETLIESHKVPYSIILFISSLIILLIGFIRKSRFLRLYSLILLMMVLAKMLIFDLGSMSNTGRMILFFILGTILLFISFFYSRIRHFFIRSSGKSKNTVLSSTEESTGEKN